MDSVSVWYGMIFVQRDKKKPNFSRADGSSTQTGMCTCFSRFEEMVAASGKQPVVLFAGGNSESSYESLAHVKVEKLSDRLL